MANQSVENDGIQKAEPTYIKLPSLHVLAGFLVGDDDDELGYLSTRHPLVQLRHDLLDIRLHLVIGGHFGRVLVPVVRGRNSEVEVSETRTEHIEAIFLDAGVCQFPFPTRIEKRGGTYVVKSSGG